MLHFGTVLLKAFYHNILAEKTLVNFYEHFHG